MFETYTEQEKVKINKILAREDTRQFSCCFFFPDDSSLTVPMQELPKRGQEIHISRFGITKDSRYSYGENNKIYDRVFVVKLATFVLNVPSCDKDLFLENYKMRGEVILRRSYWYYYYNFKYKLRQWLKNGTAGGRVA